MGDRSEYLKQYRIDHRDEMVAYRANHKDEIRACKATYYQDHRDEVCASQAVYRRENGDALREKDRREQAEFTEWLQVLRTNNGCEDEGPHNGRLEHHHVDPETKKHSISMMCSSSLDALEDELEKCVVLCDSCHKKRHAEMRALAA